ncbi:unnamed protein product [Oppiella nova]|uniref:oxoglutarate dehydrogenase (succinyl-transferring) n=1 Tax=Oppiella nova TaxID=334625 RepID=A0A7R9QEE3_9ACAR|nr:unnamed protein product [Oppiella nova]CAG2164128.1 unnamed protein product [Oppiella nova]
MKYIIMNISRVDRDIDDHMSVQAIIQYYQVRGHLTAQLDPLGMISANIQSPLHSVTSSSPHAVLATHNLDETDMDRVFRLSLNTRIGGAGVSALPLREILTRLEGAYCRHIGVEYMHINHSERRQWIRERFETPDAGHLSLDAKRTLLARMTRAHRFEEFVGAMWPTEKRFGLEGCEVLIPAVKAIIDASTGAGVECIVMGMAHRGRLNVLANVCGEPLDRIFGRLRGVEPPADDEGSGDLVYHLGTTRELITRCSNKSVQLTLVANPSHLEACDPVVEGVTRAEQFNRGDSKGGKVMALLLHGDAAFAAQGVVYETLQMSALAEYSTHGTIHVVVNNQIGFTTDPRAGRSSTYCTDVARALNAPVFHVNADDPEAVHYVCGVAAEWRHRFAGDCVVDLVGYRRNGHDERDDPTLTQPVMYAKIGRQVSCWERYRRRLVAENTVSEAYARELHDRYDTILTDAYERAERAAAMVSNNDWSDRPSSGFFGTGRCELTPDQPTGVAEDVLTHIGTLFGSPPPGDFAIHPAIARILASRLEMIENRSVDWTVAEAMAFGSLLKEGVHVRLSGQDVERGASGHRHHVLHHQTIDETTYRPLCHLYPDQAPYTVCNSPLSEYGVLGFEYGFSMATPNALVVWEAQSGDFLNVGQCIVDQYVSSGEAKWGLRPGLVLLLPHGMEGMGPDHSSARPERLLQLSNSDSDVFPATIDERRQLRDINMIVVNCTTPANYFHMLRRQIGLPFRKPLVVLAPKSLYRHPDATSRFDDMTPGARFAPVIPESGPAGQSAQHVKRLVFCTGKTFYDLVSARSAKHLDRDVAIVRVEQLSPFPFAAIRDELRKYPNADLLWSQEEHKNQGFWAYVRPHIECVLRHLHLSHKMLGYAGRAIKK